MIKSQEEGSNKKNSVLMKPLKIFKCGSVWPAWPAWPASLTGLLSLSQLTSFPLCFSIYRCAMLPPLPMEAACFMWALRQRASCGMGKTLMAWPLAVDPITIVAGTDGWLSSVMDGPDVAGPPACPLSSPCLSAPARISRPRARLRAAQLARTPLHSLETHRQRLRRLPATASVSVDCQPPPASPSTPAYNVAAPISSEPNCCSVRSPWWSSCLCRLLAVVPLIIVDGRA
ncbi:hypothetical protein ACLOJK_008311 [Asimina triloba]